jgi:hypothetical protein
MRGITLSDGRFIPASCVLGTLGTVTSMGLTGERRDGFAARYASDGRGQDLALVEALNFLDAVEPEGAADLRERALSQEDAGKLHQVHEALEAMADMADPDSLRVISIIHRLLADDWSLSGVYEACEEALTKAEQEPITTDQEVEDYLTGHPQ